MPGATNMDTERVYVLNRGETSGGSRLTCAVALELALLGAAAQRPVTLEKLVDVVWCLAGGLWAPASEIVHDGVQRATRAGFVADRESWVSSVPFLYSLTARGAQRFADLMRIPLPHPDDPAGPAAASIKYGLLDLVEPEDAPAVSADLRRFYLSSRAGLEARRKSLPTQRAYLDRCAGERQAWIDFRIDALDDFATGTATGGIAAATTA